MKKFLIAVAMIVAFIVLTYGTFIVLAEKGRDEVAARWRTLEPDATFAAKFPAVREKNDSAKKLEALAIPLGIGMIPNSDMDELDESSLDRSRFADFKEVADDWIKVVIESGDDTIVPPPAEVVTYLMAHRAAIDGVVELLANGEPPLWPVRTEGSPMTRPIPNLLGQMQMGKVLVAASLEAELAEDHFRAWRCQLALWTLTKGTLSRPELVSQLIGIALARRTAGVARKLEAPAPAWFGEMESFDFRRAMIDSSRSEWAASAESTFDEGFLQGLRESARAENPQLQDLIRDIAMRPFVRWGITEMERVVVEEMIRADTLEPCAIDSRAISASIEARLPVLARKLGGDFLPSTHTALSRAASVEITIEGSAKIIALKALRDAAPDRAWPAAADDLAPSRCSDARWNYARAADGSMSFAFDGKVDRPPAYQGHWIPLEYRAE